MFLPPVLNPSQFPNQLSFTDSLPSTRDQTRLLLFLPKPLSLKDVAKLLKPTGLVLEDHDDVGGGESFLQRHRVNHGDRRFWVRSQDGEPIGREILHALNGATASKLERIGPVYRIPRSTEPSGLYCPLPHVLVVKPQPEVTDEDLRKFFTSFNLLEIPAISAFLKGYRYIVLRDERDPTVYDLHLRFRAHDADTIQSVLFDVMPLVSPLASSHSPGDAYYQGGMQWNMNTIQAGGVTGHSGWELSKGNGIVVAIVDNGCDINHQDLTFSTTPSGATFNFPPPAPNVAVPFCSTTQACPGPTLDGGPASADDSAPNNTHGTQMAGIIGGKHNNGGIAGVSGECSIMSLRSKNHSLAERVVAIEYAAQKGTKIINLSWTEPQGTFDYEPWTSWKAPMNNILESAVAGGAIVCAATGNDVDPAIPPIGIGYPASHDKVVIACGASSEIDERWQLLTPKGSQYGAGLSVVAPGTNILSTTVRGQGPVTGPNSDYHPGLAGTSLGTAHVSGLAAMLMSRFPLITPQEVRLTIERTADKVNPTAYPYRYQTDTYPSGKLRYPSGPWNNEVGYGRINCYHALTFSDVYIKDCSTDSGEVPSCPPPGENFWSTSGIVVRPTDDGTFLPDDPFESSNIQPGQDNFVYVEVTNRGPAQASFTVEARLARFNMTEFEKHDWTGPSDTEHIQLDPIITTFNNAPKGTSQRAKFKLLQQYVDEFYTNTWHPCILVRVICSTDYSDLNHIDFVTDSPQVRWINNFAQRNVTFIQTKAGEKKTFPFMIGNPASAPTRIGKEMEVAIERKLHLRDRLHPPAPLTFFPAPARLSLDVDRSLFPTVTSLSRLEGVASHQRDAGARIRPRSFEFAGPTARFHIVPLDMGRAALSLETEIPKEARPGQMFQTDISQRNRQGQVVGGVTVIYHVTE